VERWKTMSEGNDTLSAMELKIMKFFWKTDVPVYVGDVVQYLKKEYGKVSARQTINTFVRRLMDKGFVEQGREYGQRLGYPYTALVSEEEYTKRLLSKYNNQYFGGSTYDFIVSLIKTQELSAEDKKRLKEYIDSTDW